MDNLIMYGDRIGILFVGMFFRFLRNSVLSFKNQTGYSRRMPHRAPANMEMPLVLPPREARPGLMVLLILIPFGSFYFEHYVW